MTLRFHSRFSVPNYSHLQSSRAVISPLIESLENRMLLSGSPRDPAFGSDGELTGYVADQVLMNGKILAHNTAGNWVRLNPDGSNDATFNPNTDIPPAQPTGVYQSDGKQLSLDRSSGALTRYNADGSVDRSFGNNGSVTTYQQQATRFLGEDT